MSAKSKGLILRIAHMKYHFFMCLIIFISIIRIVIKLDIPVIIHLGIIGLMVVFCNKEELIACLCSLLPMLGIMQNRIALLLVAVGVVIRLKKIEWKGIIPLALMVIWEVMHAGQSHLQIYGFLQDFSPLIALTILLIDNERDDCDFGFIARSFSYMSITCSVLNLMACSIQYGYSIFSLTRMGNLSSEYEDFRGLINPNTNSFICLISLCALLLLRNTMREKRSDKYLIYCLIIVILLTQSKSAILCVIITYMLFILTSKHKKLNSRVLARVFGMVIAVAVVGVFFGDVIDALLSRFTSGDFSTGRTIIDLFYFKHIISGTKYLLFGTGLYDYTTQIIKIYPYSNSIWMQYPGLATMSKGSVVYKPCHMGVLEIVVVWGIPGLFLIYLLIKSMVKKSGLKGNRTILVPLFIIFIYCLQSGFIGSYSILHALLIVYLGMKYTKSEA